MYNSEDLEMCYFDYQTEWMPRGMSIQAYCSRNNVPYKTSTGMRVSRGALITAASGCSSKSWRACYAEHKRAEQFLLHQKLHGHALQVRADTVGDPSSAGPGPGAERSVHSDVRQPQACASVHVRQALVGSLREAVCTETSVHEGGERETRRPTG